MIRFLLGVFVMIGALMFLGCPLRMVIRIGGGDWNALVGLVGFIVGILVGVVFLKKGFTLGRSYKQTLAEGAAFPVVYVLLFVLWLAAPAIFKFSEKGPGSMHAAWGLALVAGLVVGALCQRSRMCMVGGIRNAVMFKDFGLVAGFVTIILTVLVGNLILGKFNPGFTGPARCAQRRSLELPRHRLMGWGCVLLGGCPLRQLILAGQGEERQRRHRSRHDVRRGVLPQPEARLLCRRPDRQRQDRGDRRLRRGTRGLPALHEEGGGISP